MAAPITALYAGLLAILIVGLGVRVSYLRTRLRMPLGHGNDRGMERAVRMHGNAIENIPIAVALMLLYEVNGGAPWLLHVTGAALVAARCAHAWGMNEAVIGGLARTVGIAGTWLVIVALALLNISVLL
jgi:hypothetical protein